MQVDSRLKQQLKQHQSLCVSLSRWDSSDPKEADTGRGAIKGLGNVDSKEYPKIWLVKTVVLDLSSDSCVQLQ